MKLRQQPTDFMVEEDPEFTPDAKGRFFIYRIVKRSIATLDVLDILRKALRVSGKDLNASGLKDKHAVSSQLISTPKPIPATFSNAAFDWSFVGKSQRPLTADNVAGNRFTITGRALNVYEEAALAQNIDELASFGVPNFYDSQRFGGGSRSNDMPGREILFQRWEEALRLHLAVPRRKQSMKDKRIRRECAAHWGDWEKILRKLPKCRERSVIAYLEAHPTDFRGALDRIDPKLLTLYLAAYQSLLFNRALSLFLQSDNGLTLHPVKYQAGEMHFWRGLDPATLERFRATKLPLLAHDSDLSQLGAAERQAVEAALAEEGLEIGQCMVRGLDRVRLRSAWRPILIEPEELKVEGPLEDELNAGRHKLVASFRLGRGSFATVVMKRLTLVTEKPAML